MKASTTKGLIAGSIALTGLATLTISQFEGRELRAYRDIVGVWTICDGETKGVHEGQVATPAECDTKLAQNLVSYERGLDRCLVAPLPGETKVAFLSWAYNVGLGAACDSTLVKLANTGATIAACDQLMRWNRAGGREVKGLTDRRSAERMLCRKGLGLAP